MEIKKKYFCQPPLLLGKMCKISVLNTAKSEATNCLGAADCLARLQLEKQE